MTELLDVSLEFLVDDAPLWFHMRVSPGPEPNQFRLEDALCDVSVWEELDEDTLQRVPFSSPASYHDVIEAELIQHEKRPILRFVRLIAKTRDRCFDFRFPHEYMVTSELHTHDADELRASVEARGGYWYVRPGQVEDRLLIYLAPESSYDPTSDVESLRTP
jgi:hypothetical protein